MFLNKTAERLSGCLAGGLGGGVCEMSDADAGTQPLPREMMDSHRQHDNRLLVELWYLMKAAESESA